MQVRVTSLQSNTASDLQQLQREEATDAESDAARREDEEFASGFSVCTREVCKLFISNNINQVSIRALGPEASLTCNVNIL